jgi:hypothetical protein
MAGVYFQWDETQGITLTGFLKMDGSVSVLGLITISVEFYLGFTFQSPNQIYGEATVSVEVEVLFFSFGVSLTVRKQFAGGSSSAGLEGLELASLQENPGAPRPVLGASYRTPHQYAISELISQTDWETYCAAFA